MSAPTVLVIGTLVLVAWGPDNKSVSRPDALAGSIKILGQPFPSYYLLVLVLAPAVAVGLWLIFYRTRWGMLIRAATVDLVDDHLLSDPHASEILLIHAEVHPDRGEVGDDEGVLLAIHRLAARQVHDHGAPPRVGHLEHEPAGAELHVVGVGAEGQQVDGRLGFHASP